MQLLPRFFSSRLTAAQRRIYRAATLYFLLVSVAMIWPVYPIFSTVRPLVLGMPFSLFYLAVLLVVSFSVGVALYRWEIRQGLFEADRPTGRRDAAARGGGAGD